MEEIWMTCGDTESYELSSEGRIRNTKTGRILKTHFDEKGREVVCISVNEKQYTKRISRLVAEAFYEGDLREVEELEVYHRDGDKQNNRLENLAWGTRSEVVRNTYKRKKRISSNSRHIMIVETGEIFDSIGECSRVTGLSRYAISRCLNRRSLQTKEGYHFELLD